MPKNPLIIVVSNPADILTMEVQSVSGLPAQRVIGSGTSLDTARFRCNISEPLGADVEDVQAYILGEHGDSQVPVWSSATAIAGLPLEEYLKQTGKELDRAEISEHTKTGGAEVIGLKGSYLLRSRHGGFYHRRKYPERQRCHPPCCPCTGRQL